MIQLAHDNDAVARQKAQDAAREGRNNKVDKATQGKLDAAVTVAQTAEDNAKGRSGQARGFAGF